MKNPTIRNFPHSRRQFLSRAAAGAAAFSVVPGYVAGLRAGEGPNDKLNIACIGIGGRGDANVNGVRGENIVALCDVDTRRAGENFQKFPRAKRYTDFRRMLDEMDKEIDAVTISTPDHTHAVACLDAIQRGKHVYCEKPLAHSIYEIRRIMEAAHENKVITQLGNQGHSFDHIRMFCEWIWDGAIGNVHEVHAFLGIYNNHLDNLDKLSEHHPVPEGLDYDLWLGPVPYRPYHPLFLPGSWRGWSPFGCGTIGDWICHVVDPSFWALDLGAPDTVTAEVRDYDPKTQSLTFPRGVRITFEFPAKGDRGPVTLRWHDGDYPAPRPEALEPGRKMPNIGAVVYGDKGAIMHGSHGAGGARIIPEEKMKAYKPPAPTLPRVPGHHEDWLAAVKEGRSAGSNFDYGGPLTELAHLGIIAMQFPGQTLAWDAKATRFTNLPAANEYIRPTFREGWSI